MSLKKYHPYVFDHEKRIFVGAFEEMYQAEKRENFDSWHQDDTRSPHRRILLSLASDISLARIIDLGCGKGSLTHCFKTLNNEVLGYDIAPTAVAVAAERYPDISFDQADFNDIDEAGRMLSALPQAAGPTMILCAEILSYLSRWKELIPMLAAHGDYLLISLFIPDNPIGFVKNPEELSDTVEKHFHILEEVHLKVERFRIILAKRKSNEQT
jgi:SAM-dependent methyltransferase